MTTDKKQSDYYSRWYAENRDERNARRQKKYAEDSEYRTRELARRKMYSVYGSSADGGRLYRVLNGNDVEVYRIGSVAKWCETSPQVIRNYEKDGLIPPPSLSGTHRLYTDRQCELVDEVVSFMAEHRWNKDHQNKRGEVYKERVALRKRVIKEWNK